MNIYSDCSCSSCECSVSDLYDFENIDRSYTKLPNIYHSIKQTKLDKDFLLSVNDYLNRLKSNIYKDLIRRETLLRNGKNHTQNLISLIRYICKISYEQTNDIFKNSDVLKHPGIYTMAAIDYILQSHLPQRKPLFYYILNEFISMWLHENLRIIQEDLSIIVENGIQTNFLLLSNCLLKKLESICAINWERLQMIQNYRLIYFNQLMKPMDKHLNLLFGNALQLTMKRSEIPITLLYSNRTENELNNINEVDQIFRKSIAKILYSNLNEKHRIFTSIYQKPIWTEPIHPSQISVNVKDSLFLAQYQRVLRKELEDAQNIGYLSSETINLLKLPRMTRSLKKDYIAAGDHIEITHDPSKSETISYQQPWYWRQSSANSRLKDCSITSNSLFYSTEKSLDKTTYSITIEHNEEFR